MPTITDYLQIASGTGVVAQVGVWVKLVNNQTGLSYVSTALTDGAGTYTVSPPVGQYTVWTNAVSNNPADSNWKATGDTKYSVGNGILDVQTIAYAAAITPDVALGAYIIVGNLTGNITINAPIHGQPGQRICIRLTEDNVGGRTATWGAGITVSNFAINSLANGVTEAWLSTSDGVAWLLAANPPSGSYGSSTGIIVGPSSINLQSAGADMSGVQNSDAVITAARAALPNGAGSLYVPPGIIKYTSQAFNWNSVETTPLRIFGDGHGISTLQPTAAAIGLDYDLCPGLILEKLTLKASAGTTGGLRVAGCFRPLLIDVELDGTLAAAGAVGLELRDSVSATSGSYYGLFDRVWVHNWPGPNWKLKTYFNAGAIPTVQDNTFVACQARNGGSDGWLLDHAVANAWIGGDSEANTGFGVNGTVCRHSRFFGLYVENNTAGAAQWAAGVGASDMVGIIWLPSGSSGTLTAANLANLDRGSWFFDAFATLGANMHGFAGPVRLWAIPTANIPGSPASQYVSAELFDTTENRPKWNNSVGWRSLGPVGDLNYLSSLGPFPVYAGSGITVATINDSILFKIVPQRNMTLKTLVWRSGAATSGNYDIGIYDNTGALLWHKGSTAFPLINTQTNESVNGGTGVALVGGETYWLAFALDNTTAQVVAASLQGNFADICLDNTFPIGVLGTNFPLAGPVTLANRVQTTKGFMIVCREV